MVKRLAADFAFSCNLQEPLEQASAPAARAFADEPTLKRRRHRDPTRIAHLRLSSCNLDIHTIGKVSPT
jgi:hypothetical protein